MGITTRRGLSVHFLLVDRELVVVHRHFHYDPRRTVRRKSQGFLFRGPRTWRNRSVVFIDEESDLSIWAHLYSIVKTLLFPYFVSKICKRCWGEEGLGRGLVKVNRKLLFSVQTKTFYLQFVPSVAHFNILCLTISLIW